MQYGAITGATVVGVDVRLEQVNVAFDEVLAGDVPARLVFRF